MTRLIDLFLDGTFPKELLVERKERLETTITQLEDEHGRLSTEINAKSLTQDQIRTLKEFAAQVATGLDKADRDFGVRRNIIEILDVTATLAVEDEEKVVYAKCVFGEQRLCSKDSLSGGVGRKTDKLTLTAWLALYPVPGNGGQSIEEHGISVKAPTIIDNM